MSAGRRHMSMRLAAAALAAVVLLAGATACQTNRGTLASASDGSRPTYAGNDRNLYAGDAPTEIVGLWLVTEMAEVASVADRCVALTLPLNDNSFRVEDQDTAFAVSATSAFLIRRSGGLRGSDTITAIIGDAGAPMVLENQHLAGFAPGNDFAFIAALADTREAVFGVAIERQGDIDVLLFATEGFRDAYATLGRTCGFDPSPILGY